MLKTLQTLTDFEVSGLHANVCLADGHAYHDLHPDFERIVDGLPTIWRDAAKLSIPEAEQRFNQSYSSLIKAPILFDYPHFRICPTASNSIDLVAAVLKHLQLNTVMIEPTFDNLSLLIRRRGVPLQHVSDKVLFDAAEANEIESRLPQLQQFDALFLVHPNNPTGLILSEYAFKNIIDFCKRHDIVMIVDNCFRMHRRQFFNDYELLISKSVKFITFEDTGKVWSTQDLKASLVYFSEHLSTLFNEIYNEVYLCVSNFTLGIISHFFETTAATGIDNTLWNLVDTRRDLLRTAIAGSLLSIPSIAMDSTLPVEWLTYAGANKNDLSICRDLRLLDLAVLPGRQFYWNSTQNPHHQKFIRISLMKREPLFLNGLTILKSYCNRLSPVNISQDRELSVA